MCCFVCVCAIGFQAFSIKIGHLGKSRLTLAIRNTWNHRIFRSNFPFIRTLCCCCCFLHGILLAWLNTCTAKHSTAHTFTHRKKHTGNNEVFGMDFIKDLSIRKAIMLIYYFAFHYIAPEKRPFAATDFRSLSVEKTIETDGERFRDSIYSN